MRLLPMSFAGAVMILAVIVIRALLINRLPKKTFLILWGVVLARLLIPFSLPSKFSIYSLVAQTVPDINIEKSTQVAHLFSDTPMWQGEVLPPVSEPIQSIPIWFILWVLGALICGIFFIVAYLKCRWEFQTSLPVENDFTQKWLNDHPLKRHLSIRQSSRFSAPLTYGVFCPVILMPKNTKWENTATLQYVLSHEYVHIRRFDTVTKLVLIVALCVHWFNPLVWAMYVLANRDLELSCDETVVRQFGEQTKSAYARMLISMEETRSGLTPLCNNFSKNAIEERIGAIMKIGKTTRLSLALASVIVVGMTTVFATSAFASNNANLQNTDTAQFVGYTRNLGNGTEYSMDNGETWISEEKYNELYPQQDIVYWTYEEYNEYLEEQIPVWQSLIGAKYKNEKGEWVEWTQETVDQCIVQAKEELEAIKNGALVSRTIDGENNPNFGITINNLNSDVDVAYTTTIMDQKGQEINLGSFPTEEERSTAIRNYCDEQIKLGNMTKEYAENLINELQ